MANFNDDDKLGKGKEMVVKLSNLYNNGENTTLVSICAEQVSIVDENIRDTWLLETAKATLDRLSALKANTVLEQEVAAGVKQGFMGL